MTDSPPQIEIQLGHLCNNRCVFCVSGQVSEWKQARQIPADPVITELRQARERGVTKVTFLGGEPTLQRSFFTALAAAHELGYTEIVLFTNGVKTCDPAFIDRVLALGPVTWRFSLQGADHEHHDATTCNPGSFQRILDSLATLRDQGATITSNMCLTTTNYRSVAAFPALMADYGVRQLHIDMVRPSDAGERTKEYLRSILPRYSDMRDDLRRMLDGFDEGFDVNLGNYPFCLLPEHAHRIHHDGEHTVTVSASGQSGLEAAWDKYEVKRLDKSHPPPCDRCLFKPRCNGLFELYQEFYGTEEVDPITPERLRVVDPGMRFFPLHLARGLEAVSVPQPRWSARIATDEPARHVTVQLVERGGPGVVRLDLRPPGAADPGGRTPDMRADRFDAWVSLGSATDPTAGAGAAVWALTALAEGAQVTEAADAGAIARRHAELGRLLRMAEAVRAQRGFGAWTPVQPVATPDGLDIVLTRGSAALRVHLRRPAESGGRPGVAYTFDPPDAVPADEQRALLSQVFEALRGRPRAAA
ncbi:MAG: hypothetical protein AMXMBFR64_27370 [Myxococcales bacterium]